MTDKPLYERRDGFREPILDTPEKLRDFLKRTHHEDEPQLWKVSWQSLDDTKVYIWYKGTAHMASSHVVRVLRELPPAAEPPSLMSRIVDFLFN